MLSLLFRFSNYYLLALLALTLIPVFLGEERALAVYRSWPYLGAWGLLAMALIVSLVGRLTRRKLGLPSGILHLALLLLFGGLLVRGTHPDQGEFSLKPGMSAALEGTTFVLKDFSIPRNPDGSVEQYISTLSIAGRDRIVSVNHPVFLRRHMLYQKAFREDVTGFDVAVAEKSGAIFERTNVRVGARTSLDQGRTLVCDAFYPDFFMDEEGFPGTLSEEPLNPILHYEIRSVEGHVIEKGYAFPSDLDAVHYPDHRYQVELIGIRSDRTSVLGYVSTGGILLLLTASLLFLAGCVFRFLPRPARKDPP